MVTLTSAKKRPTAPKSIKVGNFGCSNCAHRWQSARAQQGAYQKCKHCLTPCYPREFQWQPANKLGNMNRETFIGHNSDLCGKCIELGHSCQAESELGNESEIVVPVEEFFLVAIVKTKVSQKERKRLAKMKAQVELKIEEGTFDGSNDAFPLDICLEAMKDPRCEKLKLSDCASFGNAGALAVASLLRTNTTLKSLNMASCEISEEGTVALAKALEENTTLEEFIFYGNEVGTEGGLAIAEMLTKNKVLKCLFGDVEGC